LAIGLLTVDELSPVAGLHEYVLPGSAVSPIAAPEGFNMQVLVNGLPALTVGGVLFTVTVTDEVAEHPVAVVVFVTVYVVVVAGLAVGLLTVDELNPVAGLHE